MNTNARQPDWLSELGEPPYTPYPAVVTVSQIEYDTLRTSYGQLREAVDKLLRGEMTLTGLAAVRKGIRP